MPVVADVRGGRKTDEDGPMQLPRLSGSTFAMIGGGAIALGAAAGLTIGQSSGSSAPSASDLGRNMLIGAGILGTANLGALLLPSSPKMLLAVGAGALAGAAYTLGQSYGVATK